MKASDVAYKFMSGDKLTLEEFKVAIKKQFIEYTAKNGDQVTPTTDKEICQAYLAFIGEYYETPHSRGYICGQHPTKVISEDETGHTFCAWGIHMDQLNPKYLTRENWRFLRRRFGRDLVKKTVKA